MTRWSSCPTATVASLLRGADDEPAGPVDDAALAYAERHLLLPTVWSRGVASGRWSPIPADALAAVSQRFTDNRVPSSVGLQRAHAANGDRNADLFEQAATVLTHLAGAGVRAVPLKGLHALLAGWWTDPAARVLRDLDILVPVASSSRAVAVLHDLGYRRSVEPDPLADHEWPAMRLSGRAGSVELHWRPLVSRLPLLDPEPVLERGVLTTTEAILHTIAHAQLQDDAHLLGRIPLRSLDEVSMVAAGPFGIEIDWDRIRCAFSAIRADSALDVFLTLARDLFDAPVPQPRRHRSADRHAALARSLAARPRLDRMFEKAAFQRRQLDGDRLTALYPGQRPLWSLRLRHLATGTARTARAGLSEAR